MKWIDVNKGDKHNPIVRSRLVGKEFNTHNDTAMFAATPLAALRTIVHIAATVDKQAHKPKPIMINDVSRAYFYAPVPKDQYMLVELPP